MSFPKNRSLYVKQALHRADKASEFTQSQVRVLSLLYISNHVPERATDNKTVKSFNHEDTKKITSYINGIFTSLNSKKKTIYVVRCVQD